jgi:SAM-dependent methyltransferase
MSANIIRRTLRNAALGSIAPIKRLYDDRLRLVEENRALAAKVELLSKAAKVDNSYVDFSPQVLNYRRAHFEAHGRIAPEDGLPTARAFPGHGAGLNYRQKLVGLLDLSGTGAELGPLNIPMLSKDECRVLYLDHLDTAGLKEKYGGLAGIVEIDRPMVGDSIEETLEADAPLDFIVTSHVMEHVPNPIRWMREAASVLRVGGLLAIAIPDRRFTFDMFREESRASDLVDAFLRDDIVPSTRSVYDHHSQAVSVNMHWALPVSLYPDQVAAGRGGNPPPIISVNYMGIAREALAGKYLDVHLWVFTPPSFLLAMSQIAGEGLLPFRCKQFYPTDLAATDRDNHSIIAILEKVEGSTPTDELRRSFLEPLGI